LFDPIRTDVESPRWRPDLTGARRLVVLGAALLLIAGTGWLDHFTGQVALSPLYLVAICTGTWFLGSETGVALAVVSALTGLVADLTTATATSSVLVPWWNGAVRLSVFLFVVWLLSRFSAATKRIAESAEADRTAARRLLEADELKNTFLSAVSHELRTPLAAILGCARTLQDLDPSLGPEDRAGLIRAVVENSRKLDRLLEELLDLDRLSRGVVDVDRRPVDLAKAAAAVVESVDLTDRPIHLESETLVAVVDEAKFERILDNLLRNAGKYTPPGCPVWVRLFRRGGVPTLVVEDAGPGIAPSERARIFEPFDRGVAASGTKPGFGLGLSLVQSFATLHGGRAWVEERAGGGASFWVELPDDGYRSPEDEEVLESTPGMLDQLAAS
jgi:signal transduction histidine kinase